MHTDHLNSGDKKTLQQLFQHPTSQNVMFHDVVSLMKHLGTVEEENNGHLLLTVNGISQVLHRSQGKEISNVQEILDLRHFLQSAGHEEKAAANGPDLRLVVVINRKQGLVYRSEDKGSVPEHFEPYDPEGSLNRLIHTDGVDKASRAPENLAYYQAIAATLASAGEVLLVGNGTGSSCSATHFVDFLTSHYPEIASRVVGTVTLDIEALTEDEILQKARAFYVAYNASTVHDALAH